MHLNGAFAQMRFVTSVYHVLTKCADDAAPRQQRRARKAKLRVWTPEIIAALTGKKDAFYCLKVSGRPQDGVKQLLFQKRVTTAV